ncbi:MAG: hypothetical protein COW66_13120 [Flavobacteriaceae bacterium CG18_big_fil_WC_8_21_14_2_50_34_36]|nr:hypothetical protein [Flavobacteriia bacterium]NCT18035.1 hypothetical protein [Flavobacteriia bacterium]PIQ17208.1 MAG: hypothetical protein COW66_13120 [Flavobacteriaceae bacterium CG18_big_fil_WC_8_21_14_2_50_34_36]PJC08198.1 MAG: hypothetical protein CO068_02115 [Flavobacteriaceae bacterium CG_4_9_14_0_8_um_filter_34_30]
MRKISLTFGNVYLSREEMRFIKGGSSGGTCVSDECCTGGCAELVDDSWQCSGCCIAAEPGPAPIC